MNILVHVVSSLIISANSASRILFSAYISLFTIQPLGLNVAIQLDSLAFYWLVLNIYCVHVVPFEMEYMSQVTIDLKNTTCAFSKIVFSLQKQYRHLKKVPFCLYTVYVWYSNINLNLIVDHFFALLYHSYLIIIVKSQQ